LVIDGLTGPRRSAYLDGLQLLAGRDLSVAQLRARLSERDHNRDDIDQAIEHLLETGALDDGRVARAYITRALEVKGRGRLRIQRDLREMGIARDVAGEALTEIFGNVDERNLIAKALQKKLRGARKIRTQAEYARLYQFLMRQGFSQAGVTAALRALRKESRGES
jgi:regulatory protein